MRSHNEVLKRSFASDIQITPSNCCQLFKTDTVTSEFAQLFLARWIYIALQVVLESLMEQHSFLIDKTLKIATILLQLIENSFVAI